MKKIILATMALLTGFGTWAQMQTPQPSPASSLKQMVGLTEIEVEYSRPSMRGRKIFGELTPFDALWRTGANRNTMITFSDAVTIGGKTVDAGSYSIFTKPGANQWEVYFYKDVNNWGTPAKWDEAMVAAQVTVPVSPIESPVETFTISIDDLHNNGAAIGMMWENTYIGIPFTVPTKEKAMKSIEAVMSGPSGGDYYAAASYYFEEGLDLQKAKSWIDMAVESNPKAYWMARRQSLIYAKLGDKKGAIAAAKKSLAAAEEAGNQDYVKMNKDSLKEWGAM